MKNQYKRTEETIEEIIGWRIEHTYYTSEDVDKVEDLEIDGEPNVLIYRNDYGEGDEFINIYRSVRIMMTTRYTINEDKYKKLPENVDYVIVENRIYEVKDENDMINFMTSLRAEEYIRNMMEGEIDNEINRKGETLLMKACEWKKEELVRELMGRMSEESINRMNKYGETALFYGCRAGIEESIMIEMIRRMKDDTINRWNEEGETVLQYVCYNKMERMAMEMIPRMSEEGISRWNREGETVLLHACINRMERVAMEMIMRMTGEAINKYTKRGETVLHVVCHNRMERLAVELIRRMSKEAIRKKIYGKTGADKIARRVKMRRVEEMIEQRMKE